MNVRTRVLRASLVVSAGIGLVQVAFLAAAWRLFLWL